MELILSIIISIISFSTFIHSIPTDIQTSFNNEGSKIVITIPIVNKSDEQMFLIGTREALGQNSLKLFDVDGNGRNGISLIIKNGMIDFNIGVSELDAGQSEWHASSITKLFNSEVDKL